MSIAHASKRWLIVGGAGFVGSHFVDRLLGAEAAERVTVYDNFSSGRDWHLKAHADDDRLAIVRRDVGDLEALTEAMSGHDTIIHLASNPDIAAAMTDPMIDFREGTALTNNVVEAMRRAGVRDLLYASGSGVYGDLGEAWIHEDHSPLEPVSTYGASKLAGEALIGAYCQMFGLTGRCFRFANVVGPRQTHGVGFDFVRRLMKEPGRLRILGDGRQSKSYIHASDVVNAVLTAHARESRAFQVYNVATLDAITVTEIADLACEIVDLDAEAVRYEYTGGDRGWKGDVPIVRLNSERIRALGWVNRFDTRAAMADAMAAMRRSVESGDLALPEEL
jgi:UDP-glucose 4-epimerase